MKKNQKLFTSTILTTLILSTPEATRAMEDEEKDLP
ncbi:MAG: hypothetical protein K0R52_561, partial [Alphaproteobacteria bacterium]|nr:hypothetical protein [Alphaproteobacteria bacterium]